MQLLRERLFRALAAVESIAETLKGLKNHCADLEKLGFLFLRSTVHAELEQFESRMRVHKRALLRLLNVSQGGLTLVSIKSLRGSRCEQKVPVLTYEISPI